MCRTLPYNAAVSFFSYMYWSETGWDFPRIERATLAGTERRIIMDEHPALIPKLLINGLVIDFSSDLLYWVDAQTDIIERMKLDEERKAETVHTTTSHNLYSFGLTWYENILYASELRSRSIERVNVTAGEHLRNMGWLTEKMTYRIALNSSSREPSGELNSLIKAYFSVVIRQRRCKYSEIIDGYDR